jgi:hypothetical protein
VVGSVINNYYQHLCKHKISSLRGEKATCAVTDLLLSNTNATNNSHTYNLNHTYNPIMDFFLLIVVCIICMLEVVRVTV